MAWLPGAIRKPVIRFNAGGDRCVAMARYDGVCSHIAVSNGASLFNYFNQPGNPTSHFYVRKTAPAGATMADFEQYVDTRYRAPANLEGNPRLISIETQGGVGDDLNNGWTPLQVERIAWILAQCHKMHGIPLIAMPNSLASSRGLGYHRLGIDPWRVDGGELWSNSYGKECPGSARIKQQGVILARARAIIQSEEDMQFTDKVVGLNDSDGTDVTVQEALMRGDTAYKRVIEGGAIDQRLDALEAAPPSDANVGARLDALEAFVAKLKGALG